MVFGHTLQHIIIMAPYGVSTIGFCMVFPCATLIFSTPEPISGSPGLLWVTKGEPEQHDFVEKGSILGFEGDLCDRIELYGVQEAFGLSQLIPLEPSQAKASRDFLVFQGFGRLALLPVALRDPISSLWP